MNGKMKALLTSALTIGMVAAVAGSGVFALISDVEVSDQNVLQGGSIDLKTDGGDGTTTFKARDVKPCPHPKCEGEGEDVLDNIGENPGTLDIEVKDGDVTNAPGITFEPEPMPDDGELGESAELALYLDENGDGQFNDGDTGLAADPIGSGLCLQYPGNTTLIYSTVNAYEGCTWDDVTEITPDEQDDRFHANWQIPSDVGAEIMDDQVFVKFTFTLTQLQS